MNSVTLEDLADATILAQLAGPFREQVAARYAAYMGRIGTPDVSGEQNADWAETGIKTLFPKT